MPIITLLVAPPGAGKSTHAKDRLKFNQLNGRPTALISQDDQGKAGHMEAFLKALDNNEEIIVDRMNFNKEQRNRYLDPARKAGYATRIMVFHAPLHTCLERCNARVGHPTIKDNKSASAAVNFFFSNYERVTDDEADEVFRRGWATAYAPKVIYCDLDGTLCDVEHRRHHVMPPVKANRDTPPVRTEQATKFKKNWKAFFDGIPHDPVKKPVMEILKRFEEYNRIIYCTGRSENYRKTTTEWLVRNKAPYGEVLMRNRQDSRPDHIVKEILLDFEILTKYNVLFCLDDRNSVVNMLRSRGLTVLQVADGDF